MDQGDQRRRPSAVDRINSGMDAVKKARTAYKLARTAGTAAEVVSTSEIWIPIAIVAVIILIFVFIILLGSGGTGIGLGNEQTTPVGGAPGSGNISSCKFTRADRQEYLIKSSTLAGWINDAANSAGIPPSVLASVAMHENQNFLTTYDNNSPEIINYNFCGAEGINCTQNGQNIANRACTPEEERNGAETDRHRGLLQISSVFYPTVDACNITESLTWAANKLKDYILNNTPTEAQVKAAVAAYGGFSGQPCNTHAGYPYDYCDEVWQDYQSCQAGQIIAGDALEWAGQITSELEIGTGGSYNRMIADISNGSYNATRRTGQTELGIGENGIYWCTYLVIDSYNLADHHEISITDDGWVYYMIQHWKQLPRYVFLDYYNGAHENILRQVRPGYAIFFLNDPNATEPRSDGDHAAIVKSISFNPQGDGVLETYDSNLSSGVVTTYPIVGWDIRETLRGLPGHTNYSVMGLGYAQ